MTSPRRTPAPLSTATASTRTSRPLLALVLVLAGLAGACAGESVAVGAGGRPSDERVTVPDPDGGPGGGTAMCAPGVPDCVDTVVDGPAQPCPTDGCSTDPHERPDSGTVSEPDGGTDEIAYEEVHPVTTAGTPRRVAFESVVSDPGSDQLVVRWWSGVEPCHALVEVEVEESDGAVAVTVWEATVHPDDADVACIEIAQAKQHTVTLAAPLGDREVIDSTAHG